MGADGRVSRGTPKGCNVPRTVPYYGTSHGTSHKVDSPECTNAASFKKKGRSVLQGLASPSHGESAENVAVCNNENVAAVTPRLL